MMPDGKTSCGKAPLNITLRDVEPGNPVSIEPAMRAFAERKHDLVIGVGFAQGPIMETVAKDYPNLNFAIIDGVIFEADGKTPKANVASLVFKEHEGSYLVGIIAAKTTKSNILGFIGGMDIGLIHRFEKGFEEGAKSVNPNIQVIQNYVGVTDAAWNNPGKGKEIALAQISKGADVIFTEAGVSRRGELRPRRFRCGRAIRKGQRPGHAFCNRCRFKPKRRQARIRFDQYGQARR